jgi:Ca2+/Na+ antiporter
MWILGHWLLFIGSVAQVAILLSVIGYGLAGLYYLDETDKLSRVVRRQILLVMFAMVLIIIVFSDWGDKAV